MAPTKLTGMPARILGPVMAALLGLTQAVIRSLGDVTDLPARRWELPVLRWGANFPGNRSSRRVLESDGSENEPHR